MGELGLVTKIVAKINRVTSTYSVNPTGPNAQYLQGRRDALESVLKIIDKCVEAEEPKKVISPQKETLPGFADKVG